MISAARSTADNKEESTVQGREMDAMSPEPQGDVERRSSRALAFRPDQASHRATVLSNSDDQIGHAEREGSEDMIISKTQAWTVSYEDALRKSSADLQK